MDVRESFHGGAAVNAFFLADIIGASPVGDLMWWLPAFFLAALLYSGVGHGGASGYLAVMALAGFSPLVMRPSALTLNLLVAGMGTVAFLRAGHFQGKVFWPFVITSIPMAWLGGRAHLPDPIFKGLLGLALLCAGLRFFLPTPAEETGRNKAPIPAMLVAGAVIGLVSGLIGVGGGIFLTPLLLLSGWCGTKTAAAVSAPFILVNSLAGLAGKPAMLDHLPDLWPAMAVMVVLGGWIGSRWGSGVARVPQMRYVLGVILVVASTKLFLP
jgi:uncharacterized protein